MHRLLLFCLLISFCNLINAQNPPPPIPPPPPGLTPLSQCDSDGNGTEEFDLTLIDPYLNNDPSDYYPPKYFLYDDYGVSNIEIENPSAYTNISNPQYVGLRVDPIDPQQHDVIYQELELSTYILLPIEEAGIYGICTNYYPGCIDLTDGFYYQCGGFYNTNGYSYKFYQFIEDLENDVNEILNPEFYPMDLGSHEIYVKAENLITGSVETSSFLTEVVDPPQITVQEPVYKIVENDGDGIEVFDLTTHPFTVFDPYFSNYFVTYHLDEADLEWGDNPISNTTAFSNTANPQIVYVRVSNIDYYGSCEVGGNYCYTYDSFQLVVENCLDADEDGICDSDDNCPNLNDSLIGTACDDGDPCTINDVYTDDCGCEGTFLDSDNDGVCDSDDICPGGDDTVDNDQNGVPDDCQPICVNTVANFNNNTLTHTGSGTNSITYTFPEDSKDASFSISGLSSKTKGKPANQYIEQVTINFVKGDGSTGIIGPIDATQGSTISDISINGELREITVVLSDARNGNSGSSTMEVTLGEISYCVLEFLCLPDSDGDGICDAEDQCPDFDDNFIGTACDDGDACTVNDTYKTDCGCSGEYLDADNDGVCSGDDPDDNDGCVPNSGSEACAPCGDITNDDFENGLGNWNDGGNDASLVNNNGVDGSASVRLRGNSGINSSIFTNSLDLSGYTILNLSFSYNTSGMRSGNGFILEVSANGGNSFTQLANWTLGTDFSNNVQYYENVSLSSSLSASTVLRFRCLGSSKKTAVYLDEIVVTDCDINNTSKGSQISRLKNSSEFKVYPNPASSGITVSTKDKTTLNLSVMNILGQEVMKKELNFETDSSVYIDVSNLSSGVYIINFTDSLKTLIRQQKLVIDK